MRKRARGNVVEDLRRMVVTGELAGGTLLGEAYLSEVLNCSRTPLREALQELSHRSLIMLPPRRGILIPELSIVNLQQAYEAMLVMGQAWTELATRRISDQQLEQMKEIVRQQERCSKLADLYNLTQLGGRFGVVMAEATGNRYWVHSTTQLEDAIAPFVYAAYDRAGIADLSIAEHWQIIAALQSKDMDLVRRRLHEHAIKGRARIVNTLALGDQSG